MRVHHVSLGVALALLAAGTAARADSAKLVNPANGHAYQRFDSALDWTSARDACAGLGAHLATIADPEEDTWIRDNLTSGVINVWAGGTDEMIEGQWTWVTGEPWGYTNWEPLEPNGGTSENYLVINWFYAGGWNDWIGSIPGAWLCEWEAPRQYTAVTRIPDVSGDRVADHALLALDAGVWFLVTVDTATGSQLKQATLGEMTVITPGGLTAAGNLISVLLTDSNGASTLQLRNRFTLTLVKTVTLPN